MKGLLGLVQGKEKQMYVLTNKERSLGAGTFLYPGVLPSSIHECILIPEEEGMYQEALTEIVTEINESQVDPKEVLSDQAYFYSAEDKRVHL